MEIIKTKYPFHQNSDALTDVAIFYKLKDIDVDTEYSLVDMDIIKLMPGGCQHVRQAQAYIDAITEKSNKKYLFLCQHILSQTLNWYGNLVATPNTRTDDDFISNPIVALNYREKAGRDKISNLFSFIGWRNTHPIRSVLVDTYPTHCKDTGSWGASYSGAKVDKYLDDIERSVFCLCPRGPGLSSIRIAEVMVMGRIPVIISDGYDKPYNDVLDWDEFSVTVPESDACRIFEILSKYTDDDKVSMMDRVDEVYAEFFSKDNVYKSILIHLESIRN